MKTPICELTFDPNLRRFSIHGDSGGQLEYVSQRIETRTRPTGEVYQVMILTFTDHDVWAMNHEGLKEGKYYEYEFPLVEGI